MAQRFVPGETRRDPIDHRRELRLPPIRVYAMSRGRPRLIQLSSQTPNNAAVPAPPSADTPASVIAIYGCSTDMGGGLSRGQGEAAAGTVVSAAASSWPGEFWWCRACRCRRVVSLKCAGWLPQDGTFESE